MHRGSCRIASGIGPTTTQQTSRTDMAKKTAAPTARAKKSPAKSPATKKTGATKRSAPNADEASQSGLVLVPRSSKVPAQDSEFLTTAQGQRLSHTDDSLKAGERGPTLMDDFHLREKIMHFDHERIPERVVHARGVGVHGVFESYGAAANLTTAAFLQPDAVTPVFTRFSTVVGSRGSADTVRDVRGFAVKFYTAEGVFDLVGNNIPVFFIRDGIKFPDLIHAAKPEPDREIPQAQTAHTTFWDFVSALPESPHMLMWVMSDRAIPRSYRMMEGFGVHTFRLVNAKGQTSLVKFHWKPVLGVHGLVWDEAQTLAGVDPDYHRRDLYNSIGAGAFPEWELGVQVMPDREDQTFEGIDLLDATKLVPEELAPVQPIGRMTLNRNPTNFFAETEQVAFHTGHLVRGIEVTDDPLMQARLFSYLDTQLNRFGSANFSQIPINRPVTPVNDNHRDGFMQMAVHHGRTPYLPNNVGGGCPFLAADEDGGSIHVPRAVNGPKTRERSPDDEYTQARLFWKSMTEVEQDHIVDAYTFELGKVDVPAVVTLMVERLARIDTELATRIAMGLGVTVPNVAPEGDDMAPSPALAMVTEDDFPIDGRVVHILANDGCDTAGITALKEELLELGAAVHVVATHKGAITGDDGSELTVDRSFHTASSAEADGVIVAAGTNLQTNPAVVTYVQSTYRHYKTLAAWGDGLGLLTQAGVDVEAAGVVLSDAAAGMAVDVATALSVHRHWARAATHPTRLANEV
jgi:catalase